MNSSYSHRFKVYLIDWILDRMNSELGGFDGVSLTKGQQKHNVWNKFDNVGPTSSDEVGEFFVHVNVRKEKPTLDETWMRKIAII